MIKKYRNVVLIRRPKRVGTKQSPLHLLLWPSMKVPIATIALSSSCKWISRLCLWSVNYAGNLRLLQRGEIKNRIHGPRALPLLLLVLLS